MRLVVDTNVFVSAAIKVNSLPFLVVRWIDRTAVCSNLP
jgi:predicted nucleic acid-binding protein